MNVCKAFRRPKAACNESFDCIGIMQHIVIIDYHMGNLRSVSKAIEHVSDGRAQISISNDQRLIRDADKVVFPGQGAARDCMAEIHQLELADCIRDVASDRPFLGICMGLQVLLDVSDESPDTPCLGVLGGRVHRLPTLDQTGARVTIPQMGWNEVRQTQPHPLWHNIGSGERFYFMNSYYADPSDEQVVMARTPYSIDFVSAAGKDALFAVQFHPEKSQHAGLQLLNNFISWNGGL